MGKSKADKRIEQLEAEREHWRKVALERTAERDNLAQELEAARIDGDVLATGTIGKYRAHIKRLIAERDQARSEADHSYTLIQDALDATYTACMKQGELAHKSLTRMDEVLGEGNTPHLVHAMAHICIQAVDRSAAEYNAWVQTLPTTLSPQILLAAIIRLAYSEGEITAALLSLAQAYSFSNHPPLICDQICRSLRTTGTVKMLWLEKLGQQWFADNVSSAPAKLLTIQEWLNLSGKRRKSGLSITEFATRRGYSRKSIERAETLRDEIESIARTLPADVKAVFDQAYEAHEEK